MPSLWCTLSQLLLAVSFGETVDIIDYTDLYLLCHTHTYYVVMIPGIAELLVRMLAQSHSQTT